MQGRCPQDTVCSVQLLGMSLEGTVSAPLAHRSQVQSSTTKTPSFGSSICSVKPRRQQTLRQIDKRTRRLCRVPHYDGAGAQRGTWSLCEASALEGDRHQRNNAGQVHEATLGVGGFGNNCPQGPGEIQGCLKYHSLLGSVLYIHMYIHVSTPVNTHTAGP